MPPILSSRPLVLKQSLHNILSCLLTSVAFSSQNTPYLVPYCLFLPLPYIMPLFSLPFVCSSEKHTIYFFLSVILLVIFSFNVTLYYIYCPIFFPYISPSFTSAFSYTRSSYVPSLILPSLPHYICQYLQISTLVLWLTRLETHTAYPSTLSSHIFPSLFLSVSNKDTPSIPSFSSSTFPSFTSSSFRRCCRSHNKDYKGGCFVPPLLIKLPTSPATEHVKSFPLTERGTSVLLSQAEDVKAVV